jgi:hypothetical protein
MSNPQSDFSERLSAAWREALKQAQEEAAQKQRPALNASEELFIRFAMLAIWVAGLSACFVLAWRVTGGSFLLTSLTMLLPLGAWYCCRFYHWGLLLPLSLIGLLALQAAILSW